MPAELLGHSRQWSDLIGRLQAGRLHHALLFEGPKGVGKATTARRLAKAAVCEGDVPACGACGACQAVEAGHHPDVVWLSAEDGRKTLAIPIDDVREVVRKLTYHRFSGARRTVIVDPAEAMLEPAANALLKTLEEPPEGTGFVLVTHNARALLPTLLSRCHRVRFGAVDEHLVAEWLGGEEAALLARWSLGCPGHAVALRDGRLEATRTMRDKALSAMAGSLGDVVDFSAAQTKGERKRWLPSVLDLLDRIDELCRDASVRASGADVGVIHADVDDVVDRWARALWPLGITRIARATWQARENLERNVSGKLVLDAVLATVRDELSRRTT